MSCKKKGPVTKRMEKSKLKLCSLLLDFANPSVCQCAFKPGKAMMCIYPAFLKCL